MRIGLNESRLDRFMGLYDNKMGEMRKKIDQWGRTTCLKKSIDLKADKTKKKRSKIKPDKLTKESILVLDRPKEITSPVSTSISPSTSRAKFSYSPPLRVEQPF